MGKKIKEVSIEAFRAYEKLQPFDFRHTGTDSVADLVVIYAPNGYGKTSFFDAIEWAITDEVGRFKSTSAILQEVKGEKGDILRNKNSEVVQGTVRIISESDGIFETKTKKRTRKMNNDYKPGELETISEELEGLLGEKNTFCTTNMLAHDKITSFLQYYTAEDKTKALEVFWDTNGYSKVLEEIKNLHDEIVKKEKALSTEVQKANKELKQYKFETDKEQEVIKLINKFNLKCMDYQIDFDNIAENSDMVLEKITTILKVEQDNINQYESRLNAIELLTNELPNFLLKKADIDVRKAEKIESEKKIELLSQVDKLMIEKEKLETKRQTINGIIKGWDLFQNIEADLLEKIHSKKKIINSKPELQRNIIEIKDTLNISKENVLKYIELRKADLEEKNLIETELKKFSENQVWLNKYTRLHNKTSYLLSKRIDKRKLLSDTISNIESFIENKCTIDQIKNYLTNEMLNSNVKLTALNNERSNQEKQISQLEERYKAAMELKDKISQLLHQGKELVEDSKTCECPLCHAKYEDFSSLIKRISVDYKSNTDIDKIKNDLEESKRLLKETIKNIAIESDKLKKSARCILERVQEDFNRQNEKIHNLQLRISDWNNLITIKQNDNEDIKRKYDSKNVSIQNIDSINLLKAQLDKHIEDLTKNIEDEDSKNAVNQELVKNLETKLRNEELKVLELDEKISLLQNNATYQSTQMYLASENLKDENTNLQSVKKTIEEIMTNVNQRIDEITTKIANSQNKVQGTKEDLNIQYNALLIKIQELTAVIDEYMLRFRKVFKNDVIVEDNLGEQLKKQESELLGKKNSVDENIAVLNGIFNEVKRLQEQKIWVNKKKDYESKKKKLNMIQTKLCTLKDSKTTVEDYIVDQTNAYFNSNTINQIYHKIDPHPTMNHIKFHTESSVKGLQTHIYTYNESEEDKMSPVLYLSSAQVNILSLCIFLAKVLTEKDKTFNTIFMDDPIQHLDGINLLAFIDLIRTITTVMGRQIVISTHNEHFYNLIKVKMDDQYYLSKFIELNSVGEVRGEINI